MLTRMKRLGATLALCVAFSGSGMAAEAIGSLVSAAAEASKVVCTSACFLRSVYVTSGAVAGYVLSYNDDVVPVNGAVTPKGCVVLPANSTVGLDYGETADIYPAGLVLVFSTTGCFTQTTSATAFFSVRRQ